MVDNGSAKPDMKAWYQLPLSEVKQALAADEGGLTSAEAKARLAKYGYNEIKFKGESTLLRFLRQFRNPLIYVLLAAAVTTAVLGMWLDSSVIMAVVLANAIIGFVQEGKAAESMEALKKLMVPNCTVVRDGVTTEIPARELVPGDVVILDEGDRVPADLRLFYARNMTAGEATLTGESVPVEKGTEPLPRPNLSPADQRCMAFSGTFVTRGSGRGLVVATAKDTEIGRIARLIEEAPRETAPPLMRKIAQFTRFLLVAVLILAAVNLVLGATLGGYDIVYSFLASVSLAVAAIPEGLPAILTIALAFGARAMARRNALVRRLPAVETLGSATVICSDKTGTLTKNEMTVVRVYAGGKEYRVTGVGYTPRGDFMQGDSRVDPKADDDLAHTLRAGLCCNNAQIRQGNGSYEILGDPTEGALVVSAAKAGISDRLPKLDEVPFESQQQYMATLHRNGEGNIIYVKGSPERVLGMCRSQLVDGAVGPLDSDAVLSRVDDMAAGALRVLALAYRDAPADKSQLTSEDLHDLVFLGLQGMIDPPRDEAIDAVAKCRKAGIRVVMVTGDHSRTAQAVARQLGIGASEEVLTGEDLSTMSDEELYQVVDRVSVFARVAPTHKYRVATQLRRRGHIVAMTGDGVNDAPALRAADLGIAMGIKGTDVTKEASDMILVDDNFASIVAAVEEGRHVYLNIRKVILYTLATNVGQGFLLISAIVLVPFLALFAERLPLEPVQILWINLYDAVALALPLLWEAREPNLLDRPPRDPKEPIADALFLRRVGLVSLLMAGGAFLVFYHYGDPAVEAHLVDEDRLIQAQTAAFVTVMMVHIFYLLTARSLTQSVFKRNPFSNRWVVGGIAITLSLHVLLIYVLPEVGFNPFRLKAFPAQWWGLILVLSAPVVLLIELEMFLTRRIRQRQRTA